MNKKEFAEIRKTLKIDRCILNRIAGCYVNGDRVKVGSFAEFAPVLKDEELIKHLELFKKLLAWKNTTTYMYPTAAEKAGGCQATLYGLRESELKDDEKLEAFYDKVIADYDCEGSFLILLAYGVYDVPGAASEGGMMEDASEEEYRHLFGCVCPVELDKPALSCHSEGHIIRPRNQDHIVKPPAAGFLFPAFNDRTSDIHSVLAYAKNEKEYEDGFLDKVVGVTGVTGADMKQAAFQEIAELAAGGPISFDTACAMQETLLEREADGRASDGMELDIRSLQDFFEECGLEIEDPDEFRKECTRILDENNCGDSIQVDRVVDTSKFEVKTADISMKTTTEQSSRFSIRTVDGHRCPVMGLDDNEPVYVNGVFVA